MSRSGVLALAVALLLLHFALRLHQLPALPIFGDEMLMVEWAESVWQGHVLWFGGESRLLGVWWTALFAPLNPWSLRVATLLFVLPGVAALLALARRLFGSRAVLPTGLLLTFAPMLFFFERLALADTHMLTPLAVLLLALERALARPRRDAAIVAGAALAAAVMVKATALALLPLPLLAVLLLPRGMNWRDRRLTLTRVYGTSLALWLPLLALLRLRNIDFLGNARYRTGGAESVFQRILASSASLEDTLVHYFGGLPLGAGILLILLALVIWPRRAGLPALASLLAAASVAVLSGHLLYRRYWLLALPPALLLCGGGLTILHDRLRRHRLASLTWLALALWLATIALPFIQTAWTAPVDLPLPRQDRLEYLEADSAGAMIPELAALLAQEARRVEGTLAVTGAIAQCNTLALYLRALPEAERIALDCPRIMSPQGSGAALDAQVASMAREQANYLVIFEEAGLVPVSDVTSIQLETLAELPRPGDFVTIRVYRPLRP